MKLESRCSDDRLRTILSVDEDSEAYKLAAHHVESWNSSKELRYEDSNGETVNKEIHKEFHIKYGRGDNNAEQWIEFKELFIKH